ncbi:MAG TPA: pyridoxal phosphate-dependent aminotransferase [Lacisediminihabitans sp.]|uniref:pyridoxal phosphate-dependent aminotransferase n=1 Tax=Lacisediminihabitans sp. TaxID=2787631 RepID=UPI002ED96344
MSSLHRSGTPTDSAVARMMADAVGESELDLSLGEPDQPLPDELVRSAKDSFDRQLTGYTPKLGLAELRDLISNDVAASTGYSPSRDDVVVTVGGTEAVAVALVASCRAGDLALIPDPAWPNYRVLSEQLGISLQTYEQGPSGDGFLDLHSIERGLDDGARLVVVNSPSNPTGALASAGVLHRLVELVRAHDAYILSDEAYEAIVFAGGRAPSPLADGGEDVTFSARTFSKTYSMTGLRVGSLVSPPSFRTRVAAVHGTVVGCAPITAQLMAIEALRSLPGRGATMSAAYRARFEAASAVLGPWMTETAAEDNGGFYLWLDAGSTGRSSAELVEDIRSRGVVVSAGEVYSPTSTGFLRVALSASDADLAAAFDVIRAVLER